MKELVLATRNIHKKREIESILSLEQIRILSLLDYPALGSIKEDGESFEENAIKKGLSTANFIHKLTLAEDSGLEVEALNWKPGIYSARFAGPEQDDRANIEKLLGLLKDIPWERRKARFRCVLALCAPKKVLEVVEGVCEGMITFAPQGKFGFGYDPVFFLPEYQKTFAELAPQVKNKISHRARAIEKIKGRIVQFMQSLDV
ncbi:MAG: non-canonical purine NTP pyrophosphatase [Candidatus Omnitrophota bacterium]|nr:MAG: non-canonical purine NTP pyrophosphatase [Candidatus Omnitrophota bacterium]